MAGKAPLSRVSNELFQPLTEQGEQLAPIQVGSKDWYHWLSDIRHQAFSFQSESGSFTARCERQRNGRYWYAYRHKGGTVRKAYLGTSNRLTLELMYSAARSLAAKLPGVSPDNQDKPPTTSQAAYDDVTNIERILHQQGRLGRKDSKRLITLAQWALDTLQAIERAQSHQYPSP